MSSIQLQGNASGTGVMAISSPNTNTNYTITLPQADTTLVGTDATQTLTNKTLDSATITGALSSGGNVGTSGQVLTSAGSGSSPTWVTASSNPAGTLIYFCAITAPTGYLKADGAAISRTTYATLFGVIGTTFGVGDGTTTFNLPDVRGQFVRAWTDGSGYDAGRSFGTLQSDAMQGHLHDIGQSQQVPFGTGGVSNPAKPGNTNSAQSSGPVTDGVNGTPRTASETRPVNIALLACIKY